jgi:hypothetical protein
MTASTLSTSGAFAAKVESCSSDKKQCIVNSRELITGDRVGLFGSNDRLVAWGKVQRMSGSRRVVQIETAYARIGGSERVALLTNVTDPLSIEQMYTPQKDKGDNMVEASLGSASYAIGPGASGYEVSGAWIIRSWMDIELVSRGFFSSMQGEVARSIVSRDYLGQESLGVDVQPLAANIVGGVAGIGYTLFSDSTVSIRPEVAGGFGYVAGVIGDRDLNAESGYQNKLNNGFGLAVRGNVQAILNLSRWHIGVGLGQTRIHDAFASTVGFSLGMSL